MKQAALLSGEWVVVCDGRKALILENAGDNKFINLRSKEVHEHADPSTHAQGTDTPGRTHPSMGTARSAMEQVDWHDASERAFLQKLALRLDDALYSWRDERFYRDCRPACSGYDTTRLHACRPPRGQSRDRQGLCEDADLRD